MNLRWNKFTMRSPGKQLRPGEDLGHRAGQREAVRAVVIPTCPTFQFEPSALQRTHAALISQRVEQAGRIRYCQGTDCDRA
jgi:hypothetical protein